MIALTIVLKTFAIPSTKPVNIFPPVLNKFKIPSQTLEATFLIAFQAVEKAFTIVSITFLMVFHNELKILATKS